MKLTITTIAAMMIGTTAFAGVFDLPPHQPNGYRDTGCDPAQQVAITNEAGEVLYYNNPSCPSVGGSSSPVSIATNSPDPEEDDEDEDDGDGEEPTAPVDPKA